VSTDYTLKERLEMFYSQYACGLHKAKFKKCAGEVADKFQDDVATLQTKLNERFVAILAPSSEKPERTIIEVEDGVGEYFSLICSKLVSFWIVN